jgi:L-cysteate sulfo-lyase
MSNDNVVDRSHLSLEDARGLTARVPRVRLAHLPTPLDAAPRLSSELGINLSIKREDCAGLAFGGNYTRMAELTIADAIASGADAIIHGAAEQSNHCRQVAAACARLGLECHLVVRNAKRTTHHRGNLLLAHLLGATIHVVDADLGDEIEAEKRRLHDRLAADHPDRSFYVFERERIGALATVAATECFFEMVQQAPGPIDHVFLSSCGANQAGFLLARDLLGLSTRIVGIAPIDWDAISIIGRCYDGARSLLGAPLPALDPARIENSPAYIGNGYGEPSAEALEAIVIAARTEALILEPVYTGKAFAGLLTAVRAREVEPTANVVFVHTGGTPLVDLYGVDLIEHLAI